MSRFAETVSPAAVRNRSIEARRAARVVKAKRERRIVDLLNRGVSVAEIAAREEVTEKRMRALVSEILARRMPEPPAEFLALQVSRLNEALLVAYGAMSGANLRAVDRVVKIVRELDRYHGLFAAGRRVLPDAPGLEHEDRLALDPPPTARPDMAPEAFEKAQIPPGNGAASDASDPQDAAPIRGEASASGLETRAQEFFALDAPLNDRPEMAPQAAEEAESAPGNGAASEASDPEDAPRSLMKPSRPASKPAQVLAFDAPPANRPETAPQELEKAQIPPGNGTVAAWARPLRDASFVSPAVAGPGAFRRLNVRATPNGMAAC